LAWLIFDAANLQNIYYYGAYKKQKGLITGRNWRYYWACWALA